MLWLRALEPPLSYSLQAQLDRTRTLKAQGRELRLIIGRMNTEESDHPELSDLANGVTWVYGNVLKTDRFGKNDPCQLTLDFSNQTDLQKIPDETFSQIVVDYSTWKFLVGQIEIVAPEFYRILTPQGRFFFEETVAGGMILYSNVENQIKYFHKTNPFALTGFAIPISRASPPGITLANEVNRLKEIAYQHMRDQYAIYFPKIKYSELHFRNTGIGDRPYPVLNKNRQIRKYFEAVK